MHTLTALRPPVERVRRIAPLLSLAVLVVLIRPSSGLALPDKVAAKILSAAHAQGTARVIVRIARTAAPEGTLTVPQQQRQRRGIAAAQGTVISELGGTN